MNCPKCKSNKIKHINTLPPEYKCEKCGRKFRTKAKITVEDIMKIMDGD